MSYYNKYLKYKNKYLNLKNQIGAGYPLSRIIPDSFKSLDCSNEIFYNNNIGSCLNASIQMMFFFTDKTKRESQYFLTQFTSEELIENSKDLLLHLLPTNILTSDKLDILPKKKY